MLTKNHVKSFIRITCLCNVTFLQSNLVLKPFRLHFLGSSTQHFFRRIHQNHAAAFLRHANCPTRGSSSSIKNHRIRNCWNIRLQILPSYGIIHFEIQRAKNFIITSRFLIVIGFYIFHNNYPFWFFSRWQSISKTTFAAATAEIP